MSYDMFLCKELPFGGRSDCICIKIFSGTSHNRALLDCGLWRHAHFPCETGFVVAATMTYRALETETTVR